MIKKKYEIIIKRKLPTWQNILSFTPFTMFYYNNKKYIYDESVIITGEDMDEIEKKLQEAIDAAIIYSADKIKDIPESEIGIYTGDRTWHLEG